MDKISALMEQPDDEELLDLVAGAIEEVHGGHTSEGLEFGPRTFYLVHDFAGPVSAGSMKYFIHESIEDLDETIKAFETIGASEAVHALRRLAELFPQGHLPACDLTPAQSSYLESYPRSLHPYQVLPTLLTWVRAHPEHFYSLLEQVEWDLPDSPPMPHPEFEAWEMAEWLRSRKVGVRCHLPSKGSVKGFMSWDSIPREPMSLVSISFSRERRDNPQTLSDLSRYVDCSTITNIGFANCRIDRGLLALLRKFPSVEKLNLYAAQLDDSSLLELADLNSLKELYLSGTDVSDDGLRGLADLPELRALYVAHSRISGEALTGFSKLSSLEIGGPAVTDADLKFLKRLGELRTLELQGIPLTAQGVESLVSNGRLRSLTLICEDLDDSALKPLSSLRELRYLHVRGVRFSPESARILAGLPALEELSIGDEVYPNEMLATLGKLRPSLKLPESE